MFKQAKSIFFWTLLYKFRRRLTLVAILLSTVLLSEWIYSDIVEYLTLTQNTQYLNILLPLKWLIIFFNIALSVYLVLSLFKGQKREVVKEDVAEKSKLEITPREKEFMSKKIRTEAEIIMDKGL